MKVSKGQSQQEIVAGIRLFSSLYGSGSPFLYQVLIMTQFPFLEPLPKWREVSTETTGQLINFRGNPVTPPLTWQDFVPKLHGMVFSPGSSDPCPYLACLQLVVGGLDWWFGDFTTKRPPEASLGLVFWKGSSQSYPYNSHLGL